MSCTVPALIASARCYSCIPAGMAQSVNTRLLCDWANVPTGPTCDPDALAFLTVAGIPVGGVEGQAVCQLVASLKAEPAAQPVGNRYWDRDYIIYPMVSNPGESSAQRAPRHAINLRNPALYTLTYPAGVGPVHSAQGMQGQGIANGVAMTGYSPGAGVGDITTNTTGRAFCYIDLKQNALSATFYGCNNASRCTLRTHFADATNMEYYWMNAAIIRPFGVSPNALGSWIVQTNAANANNRDIAYWNGFVTTAAGANTLPNRTISLFAENTGGVLTGRTHRLSGWSYGLNFTNAAHWQGYRAIWETFQAALGRGHPLGV